jgi:hypothetical protein
MASISNVHINEWMLKLNWFTIPGVLIILGRLSFGTLLKFENI